jgi:hypothetical protein
MAEERRQIEDDRRRILDDWRQMHEERRELEDVRRQLDYERRKRRPTDPSSPYFWRFFALASLALAVLILLALLLIGITDRGPLARDERQDDPSLALARLQVEEARQSVSIQESRATGEGIEAATLLASTLAPSAVEAGTETVREGEDLIGRLLTDVGFPLGKDAAETVGRAIWNRYVGTDSQPQPLPGTTDRAGSTINLTIVLRDGRRPQVITKVVPIPDD